MALPNPAGSFCSAGGINETKKAIPITAYSAGHELCHGSLGGSGSASAAVLAVVETLTIMLPVPEADIARLGGLTAQLAACGAPTQVKLTVPLKPEAVNE
jgi:hypothetical protein